MDRLLKIANCELYRGIGYETKSMERVTEFLAGSKKYSPTKVLELAAKLGKNGKHVLALVLYHCSNNMNETKTLSPEGKMDWGYRIVLGVRKSTEILIESGGKSREIGIKYGLEYMRKIVHELQMLENVHPKTRALHFPKCVDELDAAESFKDKVV